MKTYRLTVSSPDGNLFSGEAAMLSVRGSEGDLAILANHVPFVTGVRPCECIIVLPDGSERLGYTDGGLLTVSKDSVTLLSGSFRWQEK